MKRIGISDIEGKAAKGSGERGGRRTSFKHGFKRVQDSGIQYSKIKSVEICVNRWRKFFHSAPVLLHEIANTARLLKGSSRLIETWPKVHIVATLNGVLSECRAIGQHFAEQRLNLNAFRDQFLKLMRPLRSQIVRDQPGL